MKWSTALALAITVWVVVCVAMIAINYVADAKATLFDLSLAIFATYPLSAFIIRAISGDWAKWCAAFSSRTDGDVGR